MAVFSEKLVSLEVSNQEIRELANSQALACHVLSSCYVLCQSIELLLRSYE
ncbi:Uncharacterised protein [Kingella potus]|uniref:Uncharacterized protein n=1 Tax=Kingella potus TaxID=265175 RepID=A0A377R4I1_9NEIS|nr:Uncharacterised protein [Kingella potus]